jgi:hypothetical protein
MGFPNNVKVQLAPATRVCASADCLCYMELVGHYILEAVRICFLSRTCKGKGIQ